MQVDRFRILSIASVALYLVLLSSATSTALASNVTQQQALTVVRNWLARNPTPMNDVALAPTLGVTTYRCSDGAGAYHVVNLSPTGFVVVPADDKLEPILCFGQHGSFDPSPQNPLALLLDRDVAHRFASSTSVVKEQAASNHNKVKWQILLGARPDATSIGNEPGPSDVWVAPLVASQWNQTTSCFGNCYNYWTPNNDCCGCTATALAQLMRYFQWPTKCVGAKQFNCYVDGNAQTLMLRGGDGYGGPYNWNDMPLTPDAITTDSADILTWYQQIGDLCYDAGVAECTSYSAGGSGAYPSPAVLTGVFGYGNAMYCPNNVPDSTLLDMINPDLDARLPTVLSIYSGNGDGHCVLADGYGYDTGTLYHHLNVGWGSSWYGSQSIWYNLASPDLTCENYTIICGVDYNVYPQGSGEVVSGSVNLNGVPLTGANVEATAGSKQYTTTSGAHGIYAFSGLPSNTTYSITANYNGVSHSVKCYVARSVNNTATCGNVWGQNIALVSGSMYVLWRNAGQAALWNVLASGSITSKSFGPFTGWTPAALSSDTNGNAYILWNSSSGQASVWKVTPSLSLSASQTFGPYSGWTASSIAVGPDEHVHLLWNHASDNEASLFDFAIGSSYTSKPFGPYAGWQAQQIAVDSGNNTRVLWNSTSTGQASLWNITSGGIQTSQCFGPYAGWQAQYLAVGTDGLARIAWDATSTKQASVFTVASNGSYTTQAFGPTSGWVPAGLAVKNDGELELMWNSTSNELSLFDVVTSGAVTSSAYGPYSQWQAVAAAPGP